MWSERFPETEEKQTYQPSKYIVNNNSIKVRLTKISFPRLYKFVDHKHYLNSNLQL